MGTSKETAVCCTVSIVVLASLVVGLAGIIDGYHTIEEGHVGV